MFSVAIGTSNCFQGSLPAIPFVSLLTVWNFMNPSRGPGTKSSVTSTSVVVSIS